MSNPETNPETPNPEIVAIPASELIKNLPIVQVFGEGQDQIYIVLRPTDLDNGLTLQTFRKSRTVPSLRHIVVAIERHGERMAELIEQFTNFDEQTITNFVLSVEENINKHTPPEPEAEAKT